MTEESATVRVALKDYLLLRNKLPVVTLNPEGGGTSTQLIIEVFIMSSVCLTSREKYVNDLLY